MQKFFEMFVVSALSLCLGYAIGVTTADNDSIIFVIASALLGVIAMIITGVLESKDHLKLSMSTTAVAVALALAATIGVFHGLIGIFAPPIFIAIIAILGGISFPMKHYATVANAYYVAMVSLAGFVFYTPF